MPLGAPLRAGAVSTNQYLTAPFTLGLFDHRFGAHSQKIALKSQEITRVDHHIQLASPEGVEVDAQTIQVRPRADGKGALDRRARAAHAAQARDRQAAGASIAEAAA